MEDQRKSLLGTENKFAATAQQLKELMNNLMFEV